MLRSTPSLLPSQESHRRLAFLLLVLFFGVPRSCLSAETTGPPAGARPDSAEVELKRQGPVMERSDQRFLPYAGKRIRKIRVRTLEVFGASIDDTTRPTKSRLAGFLNHLNFRTRETTVRRNLLFKEGDAVDPFRLADSERILRRLGFVGDARIAVIEGSAAGDSTEVLVVVKDSWTLSLSGSPKEGNRLKVSLTEQNLLGLGHEISGAVTLDLGGMRKSESVTSYAVPNIHGSFVAGKLDYAKKPGQEAEGLAFSRELISPVLTYVGGLDLRRASSEVEDSLAFVAANTSELIDLWAGRQIHFRSGQKETGRGNIFFVSGRVRHLVFTRRPPVTPSTFYQYHNATHLLGSLALSRSQYYRTNLLYSFDRTEDVPYGFLAQVTYGLVDEESVRSAYASATLAAGEQNGRLGYGAGELRIGGYPRGGGLEQGVIRLRTLYFSHLLHAGEYRFRQFLKAEYTTGIHRSADASMDFSRDESIRGVVYDQTVTGSKRLRLDFESVTFTPWRIWGATFALFAFGDVDVIGSGRRSILTQKYYSGLGLGARIRKASLGIPALQLRFAWYPRLPIDHREFAYTAFGERRFQSIGVLGGKPEIVEY
jgi:hypothetical protein